MIDANDGVWFIDFDKCEKRKRGKWMRANLDRLHRSLVKMAAGSEQVQWREKDWADLLEGYAGGTAAKT